MKSSIRFAAISAWISAAMLIFLSCSKKELGIAAPRYCADSTLARAKAQLRAGYDLLDKGDLGAALASFDSASAVSSPIFREYHTACAYGRIGNKEKAFKALVRSVARGLDYPEAIEVDPDLASLREDPRLENLVKRARMNFERGTAGLTRGFPSFMMMADTFSTIESLDAWRAKEERIINRHRDFWTQSELVAAQAAVAGRYIASLAPLREGDSTFDAGLERVQAAMQLQMIYVPGWGGVSDLVRHEVDAYIEASPGAAGADEAKYSAGVALSLKFAKNDRRLVDAFRQAETYLLNVAKVSEFFPAAQAVKLVNDYWMGGAARDEFGPAFRGLLERFPADSLVQLTLATRLENGAVAVLWPVELGVPDLDGKVVSLEDYAGKVLLIDFWANWCTPCRAEIPGIVEAYQKYRDRGFEIVSISLDYPKWLTLEAYRDTAAALGMGWRHVYQGKGWGTDLAKRYFIASIPAAFLVGRDGSLVAWGEELRGKKLMPSVNKALGMKN